MSLARNRLTAERKNWRKDRPFGFYAKPDNNPDGSQNLLKWKCGIPGKAGTIWEGAVYPIDIEFTEDYPSAPPKCRFPANFFHPNIFPSGTVCLSILDEAKDWKPSITVKQILLGIQDLLDNPNNRDPAQERAFLLFRDNKEEYFRNVKRQRDQYVVK